MEGPEDGEGGGTYLRRYSEDEWRVCEGDVTDKEMGVENEDDEWPRGEESERDSFFTLIGRVLEQGT